MRPGPAALSLAAGTGAPAARDGASPRRRSCRTALYAALFLWGAAAGCGPSGRGDAPKPEIVLEPAENQVRDAVDSTPTEFTVGKAEDFTTWTRARMFFGRFVTGEPVVTKTSVVSDPKSPERFRYTIGRNVKEGGARYVVTCTEGGKETPDSLMNARNLARFLREGQLETTLLKK